MPNDRFPFNIVELPGKGADIATPTVVELQLDPSTGTLVARPVEAEPVSPADELPATEIARRGFFAANDDSLRRKLERIGEDDGEELFFDPGSGQLTVRRKNPSAPAQPGSAPRDDLPATEIARRGFFMGGR